MPIFLLPKLEVCQVSAKSKFRFFYVEFFLKLVGHHEKKAQNPKFSTSKSIFRPIRKFSRLTPNIKKLTLGVLSMCKVSAKSENLFSSSFIHHSSFIPTRWLGGLGRVGLVVQQGSLTARARLAIQSHFNKIQHVQD